MDSILQTSIATFLGFFAIMNPIANTAVFIGLTSSCSTEQKKKIAFKALITTFIIIAIFILVGNIIFKFFGITLPALRVAGGILIFLVGYDMLNNKKSEMHSDDEKNLSNEDVLNIAITPLAVPLLAGPGTIATAMNFAASQALSDVIITLSMFGFLCIVSYLFFIYGQIIVNKIGQSGLTMITKLMGLILAVIGIQMLIVGIHTAIQMF
ncbi:hypothetical protein CF386_11990 [Paraphotobacterium marinum]|uniref:UPF0056 membrane protein n=1 Tax=Paraphotobacterium marinum TaxID=1755811 RepID=A0A220VHM9_9GAMM|nr:MarC family protein [Paraphotobacterium marinum]ASK79756.1 hypothetical protein CF386_11990 [Paraphotobacterium marinum]